MFSEFSPISKSTWLAQVTKDLKGADIQPIIQWEFEQGLKAEALLVADETTNFAYQHVLATPTSTTGIQGWRNCMELRVTDEKTANTIALDALNQGIDEIIFIIAENQTTTLDFDTLLAAILLPYCAISFRIVGEITSFMNRYTTYIASQQYDTQTLTGSISSTLHTTPYFSQTFPTFKTLVVKPLSNATKPSEQLASVLEQVTTFLTQTNSPKQVFDALQVELALTNLFFVEIATLRAVRLLLLQLASMHGVNLEAHEVAIHAKTSLQPVANSMISNTTQAMSASIGGCTSLTITPHSTEKPAFAARIARNVSNLLKEESYFDKVTDAANGSYYIEQLTDKIAEAAWDLYRNQ